MSSGVDVTFAPFSTEPITGEYHVFDTLRESQGGKQCYCETVGGCAIGSAR